MLLALCVLASLRPTASEWVEISQQHYRKPVRLTHYPASRDDERYKPVEGVFTAVTKKYEHRVNSNGLEEDSTLKHDHSVDETIDVNDQTSQHEIYSNITLLKPTWHRSRVPDKNRINIDRLKLPGKIPAYDPGWLDIEMDQETEFVTKDVTDTEGQDIVAAIIQKVPPKGSIQRVRLSNTPVKSPSIKNAISKPNDLHYTNRFGTTTMNNDLSVVFNMKPDKTYTNNQVTIKVKASNDSKSVSHSVDNTVRTITTTNKPTQVENRNDISSSKANTNNYNKSDATKRNGVSNVDAMHEASFEADENKTLEISKINQTDKSKINESMPNPNENHDDKTVLPQGLVKKPHENVTLKKDSSNINDDIKVNTMENIMKFMKVVTETISKNTRRGVDGKVKYLNDLKNTLLNSIQSRIEATWPARARAARAARAQVEFPSSESSLMTISFLTFAVFLIKLVLQVIHTYKSKAMVMAPLVVATAGRAASRPRRRH